MAETDLHRFERIDELRKIFARKEMEFFGVDNDDMEWVFTLAKEHLRLIEYLRHFVGETVHVERSRDGYSGFINSSDK
jgi:hypothetical protein